jgi:site-specific DNA-methyltransferase (adenine-specific)
MPKPPSIDPEFRALIPPLRPEELAGLHASLQAEGCRDPLVIWGSAGLLLDGHHRYEFCEGHQIPYATVAIEPADRAAARLWIEVNQLSRRNLTDSQRAAIALGVSRRLADQHKREQRRAAGQASGRSRRGEGNGEAQASSPFEVKPKIRAREQAATAAKVPEKAVRNLAQAETMMAEAKGKQAAAELISAVRDGTKTVAQAKAEAQRERRHRQKTLDLEARAAMAKAPSACTSEIRQGHCVEVLDSIEPDCVRLAFADPTYNIGKNYGDRYNDKLPPAEYLARLEQCISAIARVLTPDGSLWLLNDWEWIWDIKLMAERAGLHLRQPIVWYESFGQSHPHPRKFARTSRPLLWLVKDPDRFVFNVDAIRVQSVRLEIGDKRADPRGKVPDDVWTFDRVAGTHSERIPGFPTQLPVELVNRVVACASDPGDLVIDPFCGSGTTGEACIELGRRFIGIELSERFAELSRLRLAGQPGGLT